MRARGHLVPAGEPDTDFELRFEVASETSNFHPRMGEVTLPDGCVVAGGPAVTIGVTTAGSDRETYVRADGTSAREGLRLSFFTTAGELARQFAVVPADAPDDAPVVEDTWRPPRADEVGPEGLQVRLIIVVRDLRGGVDFTERTLCVR